jgi:hypothetical protein
MNPEGLERGGYRKQKNYFAELKKKKWEGRVYGGKGRCG